MSNLLERRCPKTKLLIGIIGAIIALSLIYVMYNYDTGIVINFICGFASALLFYLLVTYKSNIK